MAHPPRAGIAALRRQIESSDGDGADRSASSRPGSTSGGSCGRWRKRFLPHRGWVAFATADRLWYAQGLPAAMPDLVRWEPGIRVAPYVRALKQERPVMVALVDSRKARLFEHVDGEMRELDGLRADTFVGTSPTWGCARARRAASGQRG